MSNGRLRGNGDYERGGQWTIKILRGNGDYEGRRAVGNRILMGDEKCESWRQ